MNDLAKAMRKGRRSIVELPEDMVLPAGPLRVHKVGRTIVLEPFDRPEPIAPGYYTQETLPPISDGAKAILASLDAIAPLVDVRGGEKLADGASGIELDDEGLGMDVSDEGLPGLDPDR